MSTHLKPAETIVRTKMFFILGSLYTIFTIGSFWHLHSNFIRDRDALKTHISTGINLHLNDLLGEIALADVESVKSHLDVIKKGFDLDKITLKMNAVNLLPAQIDSNPDHLETNLPSQIVNTVFPARPIDIPITGGNGEIATVQAFYQNYLENSVTKPILTTFAIQFLLMLVTISMVALVITRLIDTVFSRPSKTIISLIERISTGDFDITPQSQTNYGSKEIKTITDGLFFMTNSIKTLQNNISAQSALAAMGTLASQVAHDIRSPLSSMRAALLLLRERFGEDKEAEDMFNLLQLSSNRLDNIANGLLAKHMGDSSVEQLFSIHEVLDELIGELHASPLGQGTEFEKKYDASALYVAGDKTGISRAIGNIIKNALEAMQQNPAEKIRQLSTITKFDGNQNLTIRIQDTGPGIPADRIPLILQGGHTEGKTDGHGIGTKVIKEMVETHKGQLAIESQVGVGTTFIITLPATIQNDETVVTVPHAGSGVICVIDDEPSVREQWRLTLRSMGVSAKVYTCWEDFDAAKISIAPEGTFIVDYHFDNSEIDGLDVIRRLKARGFDKFILATAEYWKPAIKNTAQKLGVVLCPKPLPKVVLSQPVQISQTEGRTVLLIDDDDAIRLTWGALKKRFGVATLHSFPSLEAAIEAKIDPSTCDLCIIDKNIEGSQFDGARMLEYLKQNGAKTVVLATGEMESDIKKDPKFDSLDGITTEKIPSSLDKFLN